MQPSARGLCSLAASHGVGSSSSLQVGWIGTGVMGSSMCAHLVRAGHQVSVFSRTKAKTQPLLDLGARYCDSPRAVAQQSNVTFMIVGFPKDVEQVALGPDGVLHGVREEAVLVDMTTSKPSMAVHMQQEFSKKKAHTLDAPVSGGDVGAKNAALAIMVGGEHRVYSRVKPLFDLMGKNIQWMGLHGSGQHTKMVNQILIATNMIGVCEGLLYGYRAGLDLDTVIEAVGTGAAGSWSINNLGPRIVRRNFDPGFFVEHFIKDMEIALDEANRMGLSLPGLALAKQLYIAVQAQGHAKLGTHALALALEHLNNIEP